MVNHGHITVDGKRVDIPSYEVKPGQVISLRERSKNLQVVKDALEAVVGRAPFVSFDENKMEGSLVRLPEREELDANIDEAQSEFVETVLFMGAVFCCLNYLLHVTL